MTGTEISAVVLFVGIVCYLVGNMAGYSDGWAKGYRACSGDMRADPPTVGSSSTGGGDE